MSHFFGGVNGMTHN